MNSIEAIVKDILRIGNLTHIYSIIDSLQIDVLTLELPNTIAIGSKVRLVIKSTDISLSKSRLTHSSFTNQLKVRVVELEHGEILSSIGLAMGRYRLESLILNPKSLDMDIEIGDELFALISSSDISIEYL